MTKPGRELSLPRDVPSDYQLLIVRLRGYLAPQYKPRRRATGDAWVPAGGLARCDLETSSDGENALREIVQELALLGLWISKFFEHAAFYGGTALRIFHGLPRYSEDLDFSLLEPDADFDVERHLDERWQETELLFQPSFDLIERRSPLVTVY